MTIFSPPMSRRFVDGMKVFVISMDQVVIAGVQSVLACFATVASGSGEDLKAIQQVAPHLLIMDISGHAKPLLLLPTLKDVVPSAKTILLGELRDIGELQDADRLSIDGIVLTTQPPEVLLVTCQYLTSGPRREQMMPTQPNNQQNAPWLSGLTKQEQTIVDLVGQGLSNKEIADQLCISPITVRHHLTSIFDKSGATNRQKLILKAFEARPRSLQMEE